MADELGSNKLSKKPDWRKLVLPADMGRVPNTADLKQRRVSKWERYRRALPELRLDVLKGDDLSTLFLGVDPEKSLQEYKLFWRSLKDGPMAGAKKLLGFFKENRKTFHYSGWTDRAVARIVTGDAGTPDEASAARWFVNHLWKELRKGPPTKTLNALEALTHVDHGHREHWLKAARWVMSFHSKNRKDDSRARFALRVVVQSRKRLTSCGECLPEKAIALLATIVDKRPELRVQDLADRALAEYFKTSQSTLTHVRAKYRR